MHPDTRSEPTPEPAPEQPGPLGRVFTRVVAANVSSSLGDGIARVAAPLLAAQLTDDPLLVSLVAVAALLPWLLFAIPAGVLVDRIDRRLALALAGGVRALVAVGLLALHLTGALTIWWLLLVVFLYGMLETVYDGAIRAVIPSIIGRGDLPRGNSRIEATEIVVQKFLSQPLTSWLLAFSAAWALGLNAAAYAVAGGLALSLPALASGLAARRRRVAAPAPDVPDTPTGLEVPGTGRGGGAGPTEGWRTELVAGFRFIWAGPRGLQHAAHRRGDGGPDGLRRRAPVHRVPARTRDAGPGDARPRLTAGPGAGQAPGPGPVRSSASSGRRRTGRRSRPASRQGPPGSRTPSRARA